jgi:hypothetical protein
MKNADSHGSAREPAASRAGELPYLRSLLQAAAPSLRATTPGDPFADVSVEAAPASASAAPAILDAAADRPGKGAAEPATAQVQASARHSSTDTLRELSAGAQDATAPSTMPGLEQLMRWVSTPRAAADAVAEAESITVELGGKGQAARAAQRVSLPGTTASIEAPSSRVTSALASPDAARDEAQHSTQSQPAQKVSPRMPPMGEPAPTQPAQAQRAEPPRPGLELHIGQISLHVQAPPSSPAPAPSPAVTQVATPLPVAGAAQSAAHTPSPGLRFSASRHYLRWS